MELRYTKSFGGALVVEGDTIPASQTQGQKDVTIFEIDTQNKRILGTISGGRRTPSYFTADELNLSWEDDTPVVIEKSTMRQRADTIRDFRCRNLIAVLENPTDLVNIASVIRNVNALGVEKVYIVDEAKLIPDNWDDIRQHQKLNKLSVSASKWSFVKRFDTTDACFDHLESIRFQSIVTSPHVKGKQSIYLHEGDFTVFPKLAVWFGNEGRGITDRAVERSQMCVGIPMYGMVESLNLGTCSGIILYEITKQRREYQSKYRFRGKRGFRDEPLPTVVPNNR